MTQQLRRKHMSSFVLVRRLKGVLLGIVVVLGFAGIADAHRPGDAFVQPMVDRGVAYLSAHGVKDWRSETLVGYALIKCGVPKDHPRLQASVATVVKAINEDLSDRDPPHIYPAALAVMLLCEMDDQAYARQIEACLALMQRRQVANGGFAYPNQTLPDVSQTQYAVLAFWTADKHGFNVDPTIGKRALDYLLACQLPDGTFSYHGSYHGDRNATISMTAAGGGSIFIVANWMGYVDDEAVVARRPEEEGLPRSVRLVISEDAPGRTGGASKPGRKIDLDEGRFRGALGRTEGWFKSNFTVQSRSWQCYYLYGFERYASFLEASSGQIEEEPAWYNQGVEFLASYQNADGSWPDLRDESGAPEVSTCFALLFLVRSTKKSLGGAEWSDGRLLGGQGLSDEAKLVMKGGRVVSLEVGRSVDDLMGVLDSSGEDGDLGVLGAVDLLTLDKDDPAKLAQQLSTLRSLVNHKDFNVRFLAVKALGETQDLDNVPPLIYALTDPAQDVVTQAADSLQRIARKFADPDYALRETFTKEDAERLRSKWIEWYLSVRPGAELFVPGRG